MSTDRPRSTAITIEDSSDISIGRGRIIGADVGIHAARSSNIRIGDFQFLSRDVVVALERSDAQALVAALGLPATASPQLTAEALARVASTDGSPEAAVAVVKDSRLMRALGSTADVIAIAQLLVQAHTSGFVARILEVLSRG